MSSPHDILELPADQPIESDSTPFPLTAGETTPYPDLEASVSSKLTSSDKLSALPPASSNRHGRMRTPPRVTPRIFDVTHSLPSLFSPTPPVTTIELAPIGLSQHASSMSEGSKETTKQKVSFDSDRASLPSFQNLRQALSAQLHGNSDPSPYNAAEPPAGSRSNSRPSSRAHSPLRLFQWSGLHRGHSREEPFIPVDPFKLRYRLKRLSKGASAGRDSSQHEVASSDHGGGPWCQSNCTDVLPTHFCGIPSVPRLSWSGCRTFFELAQYNITIIIPREIYITLFMFRLPSLYFSRVARLFEEADVSRPDIQRMIDACNTQIPANGGGDRAAAAWAAQGAMGAGIASTAGVALGTTGQILPFPEDWAMSPALARFKNSWEAFIVSLSREWKTQNVVSALLLSAILTLFQIEDAASDPVTRTAALLSLICALMSLSYGCMYIIRFSTMRSMFKASRWAEEARRTNTILWWNVWVLLAMPAVWLAWSMVLFVTAILSFVWRTDATNDPYPRPPLSPRGALGPRVAVTGVFAIGMVYLVLIVRTLKSYGGSQGRMVSGRDPLWRIGSGEIGLTGASTGGERMRERSRDRDSRRGRERERRLPVGMTRKDVEERQIDREAEAMSNV